MNAIGPRYLDDNWRTEPDEVPIECRVAALAAGAFLYYDPGCLSAITAALVVGTHVCQKIGESDNPHYHPPTRLGMD